MWSLGFWQDTAERAVKTAAQALVGILGVGVGLFDVDWSAAGSMVAVTVLGSVASSIASHGRGQSPDSASALPVYRGRHRSDTES